jgi:hypothetical protein
MRLTQFSIRRSSSAAALICFLSLVPTPVLAQATSSTQDEIRALREQMAILEAKLKDLESRTTKTESTLAQPQALPAAAQLPSNTSSNAVVSDSVAQRQTFYQNQLYVARPDNIDINPDASYINMGRTQIHLTGFAKTDVIYDLKPVGSVDSFDLGTIPVGPSLGANDVSLSVRQSRLGIDLRRETRLGTLRFVYSNDFFGSGNSVGFDLLQLYGQLDNLLIGLADSTLMDADSYADTLDYNGPVGKVFSPQAQIRYTFKLAPANTFAVSIEKPFTEFSATLATPTSTMPDIIARYRYDAEKGHFQAGAVFRSLGGFIGSTAQANTLGVGVALSGTYTMFGKDVAAGQFNFGKGMARYITGPSGRGVDVFVNKNIDLDAALALGWMGSYQHYWSDRFRSSFFGSYAKVDNGPFQPDTTYNHSAYMGGNLIWNPMGALDLGVEYLYGWQELKNGEKGNAPRIQFSAKYNVFERGGK